MKMCFFFCDQKTNEKIEIFDAFDARKLQLNWTERESVLRIEERDYEYYKREGQRNE